MSGGGDLTEKIIGEALEEPVLLARETLRCPVCGAKALEVEEYIYKVPHFGVIILTSGTCRNCGFKYRDVRTAEAGRPKKIVVRVEGEEELRYLVVKSAMAAVKVREQGYEVKPGPASTGFISTVEGLLMRIEEALEIACKDPTADREACRRHREWLAKAREGKAPFTLVICDPEGASKVAGEKAVEEGFDEECRSLYE